MSESLHPSHGAIEAMTVKRQLPRFDVPLAVWLRALPGAGFPEDRASAPELTVTENIGLHGALLPSLLAVSRGQVVEFSEAEGPFRTRARVLARLVGPDERTRLSLIFLGEDEAARDLLRRAGVFGVTSRIAVEAEVFAEVADMDAIEAAVHDAFEGVPGSWRVELTLSEAFSPPWWLLVVEGRHDVFRMSFRPAEQNAQFISGQLRDALRRRGLID